MDVSEVKIRSAKSIAAQLGVCRQTLANMEARDEFPRSVPLSDSGNRIGYLAHEVDAWLAERIAKRDAAAGSPAEASQPPMGSI